MFSENKKNWLKKFFLNQKIITLIGLIIIVFISFPLAKSSVKQYRINKEIEDFKKEIAALESNNSELKNFVSYLESDQFAEDQARLNLNLKKPGEELTIIKNDLANLSSSATTVDGSLPGGKNFNQELSNPKKWLYFFLKTAN